MRTRPLLLAACSLALVLGATACSRSDDLLLVAGSAEQGDQVVKVWAVEPGDPLDDSAIVSKSAAGPLNISTRDEVGRVWVNNLSRAWKGGLLVGTQLQAGTQLTAGEPGGEQTTIAGADQLDVVVTDRGVFSYEAAGCKLATKVEKAAVVGEGTCTVSDDARWVVSWPSDGGPLSIRDLRHDTVRKVEGSFTEATVLGHDDRVLAVEQADGRSVAKLIDATDGSVVKSLDPVDGMGVVPSNPEATGFALVTADGRSTSLWWVDTDGTQTRVTTAESGEVLMPVTMADGVHYLRIGADPQKTALFHWSPGGSPEKLIEGDLTATPVSPDQVLVTRQTGAGLQFWHTTEPDEMSREPDLTLESDATSHMVVSKAILHDDVVHAQVDASTGSTYVRIDLSGDDDDAPVRDWPLLAMLSMDTDGTMLLVGSSDPVDRETGATSAQKLLVVPPGAEDFDVVAEADAFGLSLVHEGAVFYTTANEAGEVSVWKVRESSKDDPAPERLYRKAQIAGAAWPEYGGAVDLRTTDAVEITQQASGQQGSGAAGSGAAGSGAAGSGAAGSGAAGSPDLSGLSVNEDGQIVDQDGNVIDPSQIPGLTGGETGQSTGQSSPSGEPEPAGPGTTVDPTAP